MLVHTDPGKGPETEKSTSVRRGQRKTEEGGLGHSSLVINRIY